jgi:hypothetical protein
MTPVVATCLDTLPDADFEEDLEQRQVCNRPEMQKIFNNNHLQLSRNAGSQGKSLIQILNTFHNLKCSLSFQVVQHERERDITIPNFNI